MRWSGVLNELGTYCADEVTENMMLTEMVTDGGGALHGNWQDMWHYTWDVSWEEPAVGTGTMKARFIFLCDDGSGETIAIRAQHGMSARIGVSISVSHSPFPITALRYALSFFHMTTTAALSYIVLSGMNRGVALDQCIAYIHFGTPGPSTCNNGVQVTITTFLLCLIRAAMLIIWAGVIHDQELCYQKLGRVYLMKLLGTFKRVCKTNVHNVQTVLQAADQGQTEIDPDVPVGELMPDSKFKSGHGFVCGTLGTTHTPILNMPDRYAWHPTLQVCPGCNLHVPVGWIRCPSRKVKYNIQDNITSLPFSPTHHVHNTVLPKRITDRWNAIHRTAH